MSLTFRIHCEFPPPPRARWARADFQELKKEARRELRHLANQFRKDLRASLRVCLGAAARKSLRN